VVEVGLQGIEKGASGMEFDSETRRLQRHAGLPNYNQQPSSGLSICREIRRWQRSNGELSLEALTLDVIDCLEAINTTTYSETENRLKKPVDAMVAYAIAQILEELLRTLETERLPSSPHSSSFLRAARMISHAWAQLLAGDIQNLRLDLRHHNLGFGLE
jgi:hypothetical protein